MACHSEAMSMRMKEGSVTRKQVRFFSNFNMLANRPCRLLQFSRSSVHVAGTLCFDAQATRTHNRLLPHLPGALSNNYVDGCIC